MNKNLKEIKKTYDYVIIAFPLTKNIQEQNFNLDIFYKDFLDCQMNNLNAYLIDGTFSLFANEYSSKKINLHAKDASFRFQTIRSHSPTNTMNTSKSIDCNKNMIYSVITAQELNSGDLGKIFSNFKLIKKLRLSTSPFYKKVRYSYTAFPKIIIDGVKRSRIYYLNGLEWLESSKEINCMAGRNIALLIARKELTKSDYDGIIERSFKYTKTNFYFKSYRNVLSYAVFSGLFIAFVLFKKLNQISLT